MCPPKISVLSSACDRRVHYNRVHRITLQAVRAVMHIPNYDVLPELLRHGPYVVYRGRRHSDGQPVLIKVPQRVPPRRPDSEALERQFGLLKELSVRGIPRVHDLIRQPDGTRIVLEDRGLTPLRVLLDRGRLDVSSALNIVCHIAAVLSELHRRNITHGAINPSSLLVDLDREERHLLNVGLFSGVSVEGGSQGSSPDAAYMSPEQTGRMNRT